VTTPTYAVEVEFESGSYTDITPDVTTISISRNLGGVFFQLEPGDCRFSLHNPSGKYSPDNPNSSLAGLLRPALNMRVRATHSSSTYNLFTGTIDEWSVQPALESQSANASARDRIRDMRNRTITTSLISNGNVGSLFAIVFSLSEVSTWSIDALNQTVPFTWFKEKRADRAVQELIDSGYYSVFADGGGVVRVKNRHFEAIATTQASYDEFMTLAYALTDDELLNEALIKSRPRSPESAETVVGSLTGALSIQASSWISFFLDYLDPDTLEPIPAKDLVTPVSSTDWLTNANSDGSGSNTTATSSVTATLFAETVVATVFNGTGTETFLTKFNIRGKPLRRAPPLTGKAESNSSQSLYGRRVFTLESDLIGNFNFAQDYAQYLVDQFAYPIPDVGGSIVNDFPSMLGAEVGDLMHLTNSITGIASLHMITRLEHSIDLSNGNRHVLELGFQLRSSGNFLILDNDPLGKLDTDRVLGL